MSYELSDYLQGVVNSNPPLNKEEQVKLIKLAQDGDQEALDDLIVSNLRLVLSIAKKFYFPPELSLDDLISEGTFGLRSAILSFDLDRKMTLAGYAYNPIKWRINNYIRDYTNTGDLVRIDPSFLVDSREDEGPFDAIEYINHLPAPPHYDYKKMWEVQEDIKYLLSFLTEREQIILITYYGIFGFGKYPLAKIARMLPQPCSRERARQLRKEILKKLDFVSKLTSLEIAETGLKTYPMVNLNQLKRRISELDLDMMPAGDKLNTFITRYKANHPEFDISPIKHNLNLMKPRERDEFYARFENDIIKDSRLGHNSKILSYKYNCSQPTIIKIVKRAEGKSNG